MKGDFSRIFKIGGGCFEKKPVGTLFAIDTLGSKVKGDCRCESL